MQMWTHALVQLGCITLEPAKQGYVVDLDPAIR